MSEIVYYSTPSGRIPVMDYVAGLLKKNKTDDVAAIKLYVDRMEEYGREANIIKRNTYKHLDDGIYELRPSDTRIFFFFFQDGKIIMLHAIEKKRSDIPKGEIQKAKSERADYLRRNRK